MYKFKCKYQPPSVNDFSTMVVGPYERRVTGCMLNSHKRLTNY